MSRQYDVDADIQMHSLHLVKQSTATVTPTELTSPAESGLPMIDTKSAQHNLSRENSMSTPSSRRVLSPTLSEEDTNSLVLEMKEMDDYFNASKKKSKFVHLYQKKKYAANQSVTSEKNSTIAQERCCTSLCGTLRMSTVLILTIVFSLMIMVFIAIITSIIVTSYDELEKDTSKSDMKRVVKSFYDEFTNSLEIMQAVAVWDETFNVLMRHSDPNENITQWEIDMEQFLDSNIDPAQMILEKHNYALFYTLNGTLVAHRAHNLVDEDQDSTEISKIPKELVELDPETSPLFKNSHLAGTSNGGFMSVSNGVVDNSNIVMLVAKPCSQSNFKADNPTSGLIVYGRHLTYATKERNVFRASTCISFLDLNENLAKYPDVNATRVSVETNEWDNDQVLDVLVYGDLSGTTQDRHCYVKSNLNSTSPKVASTQILADLNGKPVLVLRSDMERNVYLLGVRSLGMSIGLLVFSCVVAAIVIIAFVERRVLRRIYKLSRRIQEITASHDPKQRIEIKGMNQDGSISTDRTGVIFDEIDTTSRYINDMLLSLEIVLEEQLKEQKMLKRLLERVYTAEESGTAIMNAVKDVIFIVNGESGLVINANNKFYENFERSVIEVEAKDQVFVSNLFLEIRSLEVKFQNNLTTALLSLNDGKSHIFRAVTPSGKILRFNVFISKTKVMQNNKKMISFLFMAKRDYSLSLGDNTETIAVKFEKMIENKKKRRKFKKFCAENGHLNNFMFIEAARDYKNTESPMERTNKQIEVCSKFLKKDSTCRISIGSIDLIKGEVDKILKEETPQITLFEGLSEIVESIIKSEVFTLYKIQKSNLLYT